MSNVKLEDDSKLSQPMRAQVRLELPTGSYADDDGEQKSILNSMPQPRRSTQVYRPLTIHEDETVLECCTHAHEVARAHGAREVMLEHLIHALTRVPEAVAVLEERGYHVDLLRRDSAAIIAGEIPVDQPSGQSTIRASKDFNTVMHLAAAMASGRDERSMGVRELLEALKKYDPKSRPVRLLKKHQAGGADDDAPDPLLEVRATLDRYSAEVRELRLSVVELKDVQRASISNGQAATELRLGQVEKLLSTVLSELTSERSGGSDRLRNLQDAISAQRSDTASLQRLVGDRLTLLEKAVQTQGNGGATQQLQTLVNDRLLAMQKSSDGQRGDLVRLEALINDRLKTFERNVEQHLLSTPKDQLALADRLQSLEKAIDSRALDVAKIDQMMSERLKAFERGLEGQNGGAARSWSAMSDRLFALERAVSSQRADAANLQQLVAGEIKALEKSLSMKVGNGAAYVDHAGVDRLAAIETLISNQRSEAYKVDSGMAERMKAFERMLETQLGGASKTWSSLSERLQALEKTMTSQRTDVVTINNALDDELEQVRKALVALGHAQQTLSQAIDEWRLNNSGDLSIISNRLATLEQRSAAINVPAAVVLQQQPAPISAPSLGDKVNSVRARLGIQSS